MTPTVSEEFSWPRCKNHKMQLSLLQQETWLSYVVPFLDNKIFFTEDLEFYE